VNITREPIEDDTILNKIRAEIFIISLGGSISEEIQEKQEKSKGMYQSVIPILSPRLGVTEWGPNYTLH
jgi:hypothetical protein